MPSGCVAASPARDLRQYATALDRIGRGKERDVNARFLAMASHYLFEPEFCNPASGWEKGQVKPSRRMIGRPAASASSRTRLSDRSEALLSRA
jgi:transposase